MSVINRIENLFYNRTSIIASVVFNFHYLPFKQAIKLPILLHHPLFYRLKKGRASLFSLKGKVYIDAEKVYHGMIKLGFVMTTSHHDIGFIWANEGTIVFKGETILSQGCSIRNGGVMEFGDNVHINANTKLFCFYHISIGNNVRLSWECIVCDTNFHPLKRVGTNEKTKAYAEVIIMNRVWVGQRSLIMPGSILNDDTIISAGTIVTKRSNCPTNSIIAGEASQVVSSGKYYRDFSDDSCEYDKFNYSLLYNK